MGSRGDIGSILVCLEHFQGTWVGVYAPRGQKAYKNKIRSLDETIIDNICKVEVKVILAIPPSFSPDDAHVAYGVSIIVGWVWLHLLGTVKDVLMCLRR